jgi:rfaE bifunctional protein nucleotidyltransferase chain/domain
MVISFNTLTEIRNAHRDKSIVLALGTFDILHPAHVAYLNAAKKYGDILVVTLKSDEQVRAHKGDKRPVVTESDRVFMVASLKPVDYALVGAEGDLYISALNTAKALRPDVVALGPDWGPAVISDWQRDVPDMDIVVVDNPVSRSTTAIIEKIRKDLTLS